MPEQPLPLDANRERTANGFAGDAVPYEEQQTFSPGSSSGSPNGKAATRGVSLSRRRKHKHRKQFAAKLRNAALLAVVMMVGYVIYCFFHLGSR